MSAGPLAWAAAVQVGGRGSDVVAGMASAQAVPAEAVALLAHAGSGPLRRRRYRRRVVASCLQRIQHLRHAIERGTNDLSFHADALNLAGQGRRTDVEGIPGSKARGSPPRDLTYRLAAFPRDVVSTRRSTAEDDHATAVDHIAVHASKFPRTQKRELRLFLLRRDRGHPEVKNSQLPIPNFQTFAPVLLWGLGVGSCHVIAPRCSRRCLLHRPDRRVRQEARHQHHGPG